jgi:hypothetical protein
MQNAEYNSKPRHLSTLNSRLGDEPVNLLMFGNITFSPRSL